MLNVPRPRVRAHREFLSTVARKQDVAVQTLLTNLSADIKTRYARYVSLRRTLEQVPIATRSPNEISALASCYSQTLKRRLLKDLKLRLNGYLGVHNDETLRCPYCQLGAARRWDHFLPTSVFPDFYMLHYNLVYVCETCNGDIKRDDLVNAPRSTFNPYFDDVSGFSFLKCRIVCGASKCSPKYYVDSECIPSGYLSGVLLRHFDEYDMRAKLGAEAAGIMRSFEGVLEYILRDSSDKAKSVRDQINGEVHAVNRDGLPRNHWKRALWEGVKGSQDYFDRLVQLGETLPPELTDSRV